MPESLFKHVAICFRALCLLSVAGCASAAPLSALDHVPSKVWQEPAYDRDRATVYLPGQGATSR